MPTETIDSAVARLSGEGFTDTCRAEEGGIHFRYSGQIFAPEELKINETVRLEGTSAPDEQTALFALSSPDGNLKGTFCVNYGPDADPIDADAMQRLETASEEEPSRDSDDNSLQLQF